MLTPESEYEEHAAAFEQFIWNTELTDQFEEAFQKAQDQIVKQILQNGSTSMSTVQDYCESSVSDAMGSGATYDAEQFSDYILSQNDYTMPDGEHVKVSNTFDYVYADDLGQSLPYRTHRSSLRGQRSCIRIKRAGKQKKEMRIVCIRRIRRSGFMRSKWNVFFAAVMAGRVISGNAVASEELVASAGGENEIAISAQEHAQGDVIALDDLGDFCAAFFLYSSCGEGWICLYLYRSGWFDPVCNRRRL